MKTLRTNQIVVAMLILLCGVSVLNAQSLTKLSLNKDTFNVGDTWSVKYSTSANSSYKANYKVEIYYTCVGTQYVTKNIFTLANRQDVSSSFSGNIAVISKGNSVSGLPKNISSKIKLVLYKMDGDGDYQEIDSKSVSFTVKR